MGSGVVTKTARYRLVFVQPDPDIAERVCVGLLFEDDDRQVQVVYDAKLSKLRCVAPAIDLSLVRYFLQSMETSLADSRDVDGTLRSYAPQLSASSWRNVAAPVSETAKVRLLERFAMTARPSMEAERVSVLKEADDQIHRFVQRSASSLNFPIMQHVRPHHFFGRPLPNVEAVAVGVRTSSALILVDGVDLRSSSPNKSIAQTNRVVHAFWQWGRLRADDLFSDGLELRRVGVVLNGVVPKGRNVKRLLDAHDYARDQLTKESELTIESSSDYDTERFREMLTMGPSRPF